MREFYLPSEFSGIDTSDPEFNKALEYILHTDYNIFINGPAGVGKSVLLRIAYKCLKGTVMVISSTGISACHLVDQGIPASTIHRGLYVKPQDIFSFFSLTENELKGVDVLMGVDTLLIEEVGMVSACLFDEIGKLVSKAERKRKKPIRVICFGDVLQLPPVVKDEEKVSKVYQDRYKGNIFFFHSNFYREHNFFLVSLNTIYRQSSESFQNVLNRIRLGIPDSDDFNKINKQKKPLEVFKKEHPLSLILAPTVKTVAMLNEQYGKPENSNRFGVFRAVTSGDYDWSDSGLVDRQVTLWEGQQVMCIHNKESYYQNGTLGIVTRIYDDSVVVRKATGEEVLVEKHVWPQYVYDYDPSTGEVVAHESGKAVQIGCKPATASTIHKAQGLTLDAVYLYLKDYWIPFSGIYLGLSRCRTLEGIGLSRNIVPSDIKVMDEPLDYVLESF